MQSVQLSHPTMGAWIEIDEWETPSEVYTSHPTMGAWIEIPPSSASMDCFFVAPHDGCVD